MRKNLFFALAVLSGLVISISACGPLVSDLQILDKIENESSPILTTTPNTGGTAVPTGVTATAASSSSITISWSSVLGAGAYLVYRSTSSSGSYSYIGSVYYNYYADNGLSAGTTYYYKVSAFTNGYESSLSSYAYATTSSSSSNVPATPTSVSATASPSSSSITITWNPASVGASEYKVYRSTSPYGPYSYIGSVSYNYYIDTELSAGTTYYYKVSASNDYGESNQSSYASATTLSSSSSSATNLTSNTWYINTLSAGATHTYRFYASSGSSYNITWEDSDNSSYTCDIKVGVRRDGYSTYTVNVTDYNPIYFNPTTSDYYIVEVQGFDSNESGTYRIKYSN